MNDQKFGPFQQAANRLKQFAITNNVPNAAEIRLDGQLGDDWQEAFEAIIASPSLRGDFDYGVLRDVRNDPALRMSWFRFVGSIGQNTGHFDFLKLIAERSKEEAAGTTPVETRILLNRIRQHPEQW